MGQQNIIYHHIDLNKLQFVTLNEIVKTDADSGTFVSSKMITMTCKCTVIVVLDMNLSNTIIHTDAFETRILMAKVRWMM